MVYTSNRNVLKRRIADMASAVCAECEWTADDPLVVRSDAVDHVRKSGHTVRVEVRNLAEYAIEGKGY